MTYALLSAIRGYKGPLLHTYDINCQFSKGFWGRVTHAPAELRINQQEVDTVFKCPMMHLKGHERKCQAPFSLHYCRGAGHTSGETIETLWPPLNALAASTREMGPGHRRDMLDVGIGFQNWTKTSKFGACGLYLRVYRLTEHVHPGAHLAARMLEAVPLAERLDGEFSAFDERLREMHGVLVDEWAATYERCMAGEVRDGCNPGAVFDVAVRSTSLRSRGLRCGADPF
jgi:hypothetical protein